jgi:hypothetical protein
VITLIGDGVLVELGGPGVPDFGVSPNPETLTPLELSLSERSAIFSEVYQGRPGEAGRMLHWIQMTTGSKRVGTYGRQYRLTWEGRGLWEAIRPGPLGG